MSKTRQRSRSAAAAGASATPAGSASSAASPADRQVLVRTWAATHPNGVGISSRSLDWDQLTYAFAGVLSVQTSDGTWVVPPHRALWIPAGMRHEVEVFGRVSLRTLYFPAGMARAMPRRSRAVNVTPLLRELVLHASRLSVLRRDVPEQARLGRVILDQLHPAGQAPLQLPRPTDPRAIAAVRLLNRGDRAGTRMSLEEAARRAGASKRTLERLFLAETHMTLGRWRQRCRLVHALRLLASGSSVTEVALEVGYNTPSAFISAFRRQLGTTPGRYFDAGSFV